MCACGRLLLLAALPMIVGCGARGEVVALTGMRVGEGAGATSPLLQARQATAVRGLLGRSITLECRVLRLGDKAVSWIRSRDLQILSHGGVVFTADARVSVPRQATRGPTHALRIDRLRLSDAGRYECQLNTEPKTSSFFDLTVVDEAEAEIESTTESELEPSVEKVALWAAGGGEVRGVQGGTAELACTAQRRGAVGTPLDIHWLRYGKPLLLQEGCAESRVAGPAYAESRLRLVGLRGTDAGLYTCAVDNTTVHIRLHVQDVDTPGEMEAMQRDQSAGASGGGGGGGGRGAGAGRVSRLVATLLLLRLLAL